MDLEHNGLRIRNAVPEDAPILTLWWNDGAVMAHAGFPRGLGTTAEKVADQIRRDTDRDRRLLLLWRERPIGEMCYRLRDGGEAEIGVKICEADCRERGLGRRALSMLIGALFAMGCEQIVLDTMEEIARARHVYELLGFRFQGLLRDCWRDQEGRLRTAAAYSLRPEDFRDRTEEK